MAASVKSAAAKAVSRPAMASRPRAVACCASMMDRSLAVGAAAVLLSAGAPTGPALASVQFQVASEHVSIFKGPVKAGQTFSSPVHLEFTVKGKTVKPAADGPIEGTGHFHVLIDAEGFPEGETIPFTDAFKHYGKGQLMDDVALTPGPHKLTLQFANAKHESYGPGYASTININVK
ncbi:hypothetical protein FOA52_011079 [Chlamydomonas sp. UWO 241]|nr:hypothetical protein FOA52_011079 [Chlamydomonas sp. UWO 241]